MWSTVESGCNGSSHAAPCGRGKHSATLLAGYVYVLGGRGSGGAVPLRDFWRYSLATARWERLECRGDPPPSLQEHSAIAHEDKLYVFGGEAGALSNETPLWIYDTETQIWRKLPGQSSYSTLRRRGSKERGGGAGAGTGPRGRRGHSAHSLKDCLLIYGGYKDLRGSTHELWAFHYESESWHQVRTASASPARHRHAAVMHDNRLYVHGGQCDLRECSDLVYYDTMSRVWSQVRTPAKGSPGARSGHAALRAGAHLYLFGGETGGHPTNELWRFHFATETWERIEQGIKWPSPRVDSCVVLVPLVAGPAGPGRGPGGVGRGRAEPAGLLRELSRLSGLRVRRAAAARCSYTVLAADTDTDADSTESLAPPSVPKSRSAYVIDRRPRAARPRPRPSRDESPSEGEVPCPRTDVAREPISVPDFADMVLPTPVVSPVEAAKLVYLDSDEEEEEEEEEVEVRRREGRAPRAVVAIPKSASVRFTRETPLTDDEGDLSTSDYASAERVNRLSGVSLGFSNPHYLGPDVRNLGAALTPDSGVGPADIELQDMSRGRREGRRAGAGEPQLHLLLVGGKEPPHRALLQSPLSMWTYRLL